MTTPLTLSREFTGILDTLEHSQENYFITGKAGTGKSTLLQLFRNTTRKKMAVLAPTGIAALNVRGQTIHSFFGFPPRMMNRNEIEKRKNARLYQALEMIIIDEISMVRADLLDHIDYFLQINRGIAAPFGGVQMVFFGDLFQLPPVVSTPFEKEYFSTTYESPYFFSSHVIMNQGIRMAELSHVYRQEERQFVQLLDNIRTASLEYDDFDLLNSRCVPVPDEKDYYITLCSRNDIAQRINDQEMTALHTPQVSFTATTEGEFQPQLYPTDFQLQLKTGAQVMFIRNDIQRQYVNGTIGIIADVHENRILVNLRNPSGEQTYVEVEKQTWEIIRYEPDGTQPAIIQTKVIGRFTQYPLRPAWGITIHKSQGKTFDRVIVDLGGGAFESGQTYVALSRCRTLEGLILKKPVQYRDIILDERIVGYYQQRKYLH